MGVGDFTGSEAGGPDEDATDWETGGGAGAERGETVGEKGGGAGLGREGAAGEEDSSELRWHFWLLRATFSAMILFILSV